MTSTFGERSPHRGDSHASAQRESRNKATAQRASGQGESAQRTAEQQHLDMLLARVDSTRQMLESRLREVRKEADIDDPQGLMMRDREARDIGQRLDTLTAADIGLMFGRIDVEHDQADATDEPDNPVIAEDGTVLARRYIGRIGIHDDDATMRTLLMDWRAPQARPFYLATTLHPDGVRMRRHIRTNGRKIVSVDDERLSGPELSGAAVSGTSAAGNRSEAGAGVAKETALLEAINRARDVRMRDIVDTIAAEQDDIIRSEHRGVTVVQGGPGTGKTAVALHRAAYLLYTWREQLQNTGVLIVGPNARFMDYISQVLPSLGETGVVLATLGTLLPGIRTIAEPTLLSREVKGSAEMITILQDAVKHFQAVPEATFSFTVFGVELQVTPAMVRAARTRARRSRKPHNQAQEFFLNHLTESLAAQLAERIGADPLGGKNLLSPANRSSLTDELREEESLMEELRRFWPILTPEQVLEELYAHPEDIAPDYDEATWRGLSRYEQWTEADAPLLDELAELLGILDDEEARQAKRREWEDLLQEAQEALDILKGSASQDLDDGFDAEVLMAYDVLGAEDLAERQQVRDQLSTAQRAAKDSRWAYGHVIVDEAQEISPMAWRMIFRRCPNRWMTLVGDPAQTGNPAGVESWGEALEPFVADRWQLHELTVNYRTPHDIAELAAGLLPEISPDATMPVALRETGTGVKRVDARGDASSLRDAVRDTVARLQAENAGCGGVIGVILPPADVDGGVTINDSHDDLNGPMEVVVAEVTNVKGLEFDEVVLVDPDTIASASPQGLNDLYVAMTRATQGLTIIGESTII